MVRPPVGTRDDERSWPDGEADRSNNLSYVGWSLVVGEFVADGRSFDGTGASVACASVA